MICSHLLDQSMTKTLKFSKEQRSQVSICLENLFALNFNIFHFEHPPAMSCYVTHYNDVSKFKHSGTTDSVHTSMM
jgi:hypothetical protein